MKMSPNKNSYRSAVGAPSGFRAMMKRHASPASFTMLAPKNSAKRRAVVIAVDFNAPYSVIFLDMLRLSEMSSHSSPSGKEPP